MKKVFANQASNSSNVLAGNISVQSTLKTEHKRHLLCNLIIAISLTILVTGFQYLSAQSVDCKGRCLLSKSEVSQKGSLNNNLPKFKSSKGGLSLSTEAQYSSIKKREIEGSIKDNFRKSERVYLTDNYNYSFTIITGIDSYSDYYHRYYGLSNSLGNICGMLKGGFEYRKLRVGFNFNKPGTFYFPNYKTLDLVKRASNYVNLKIGFDI